MRAMRLRACGILESENFQRRRSKGDRAPVRFPGNPAWHSDPKVVLRPGEYYRVTPKFELDSGPIKALAGTATH